MTFASLSPGMKVADLVLHLMLGFCAGQLYFRSVWHSARLFTARPGRAVGLTVFRFGLAAGMLTLAAWEGALPLLAAAMGLMLARPFLVRRAL